MFRVSGCYYGATSKRYRPIYIHLDKEKDVVHDDRNEDDHENDDYSEDDIRDEDDFISCKKFQLKFRKMSGGVLIIWCT